MISLNEEEAKIFLAKNNIINYVIKKVAGDASFRSYYRVLFDEKTFILMFAPPSHEDIIPFIKIDEFLVKNNFSAPKIFAIDEAAGFILLEDFGDDSYGKILGSKFANDELVEESLYKNACNVLIELHKISGPQGLENYNHALLFREVMLFVDWYLPHVKKTTLSLQEKSYFKYLWFELFDLLSREKQVLVLRDYHADNLMLLKNIEGYKSVGLLDFQDAVIGCAAYDLVSLLEDARRDVSPKTREEIFTHYLGSSSINKNSFAQDYEILSLQRNIKIAGIFARLAVRDSKPQYLNLLPRVINLIKMRLTTNSPILADIAAFLQKFIY